MTTPRDDNATSWSEVAGSGSSLRAFTSTAQVPAVAGQHQFDPLAPTGTVPAVPGRRPRAPLALCLAVWLAALCVLAGLALLWIHRVRPKWLSAIEITAASPAAAPARAVPTTTAPAGKSSGPVSLTSSGSGSANVSVSSATYTVLVSTTQRCWVQATTPGSSSPVFSGILVPGSQQSLTPSQGRLTLDLGASGATVAVVLGGKHMPAWTYTPHGAPFELDFSSS